jgi:glycosyltransferase involved in cell wall biosynthesis
VMQLHAYASHAERRPAHRRKRGQDDLRAQVVVRVAEPGTSREGGILQVRVPGTILISCTDEVVSARHAEGRRGPKASPRCTKQRRRADLSNRRWRHAVLAAQRVEAGGHRGSPRDWNLCRDARGTSYCRDGNDAGDPRAASCVRPAAAGQINHEVQVTGVKSGLKRQGVYWLWTVSGIISLVPQPVGQAPAQVSLHDDDRAGRNARFTKCADAIGEPELPGLNLAASQPRRVRIVYLTGSTQLGGAERCLLDVMESVRSERPTWAFSLIASGEGPVVTMARGMGFAVDVLPFPRAVATLGDSAASDNARGLFAIALRTLGATRAIARYRAELRTLLARLQPDVVHSNGYKTHILGSWARPPRAALVWHLHDYVSSRPLMARALRWHTSRCDAAIAVSESVGRDAQAACGSKLPVRVVLNGVDLQTFRPDGPRVDLDALAGLPPAPSHVTRVGLVATLGRFKGHRVFLQAVARLPRDLNLRAYVISGSVYETRGSEESLDALRGLAESLGIGDRVGFTGFISEPASAMRALDVVVHASTTPEPFGLVIVEGMACGRAVIVSAAGGAAEIVQPGVDALTHAPGDVAGLATAIQALASDDALRERLGREALRTAIARFDRRRMGAQIVLVYEALPARVPPERTTK